MISPLNLTLLSFLVTDLRDKGEFGAEKLERAKPGRDESLAGGRQAGLSAIWS